MAFEEIKRGEWNVNKAKENRVAATTSNKTSGVRISLSHDIAKKLGDPPFVKLMLDSAAGLLLVKNSHARMQNCYSMTFKGDKDARTFTVSASRIGLKGGKFKTTELPFELTEQGLIVDIKPLLETVK